MRVKIVPEGKAQVGDYVRTPFGEIRQIVSIVNAGDLIEAIVERDIREVRAPNFMRDSIAGICVLWGDTTGRERRNRQRYLAKVNGAKG